MTRALVRELAAADLEPASRLLAARFARARDASDDPAARAPDTDACRAALEKQLAGPHARGVFATRGSEPAGFLLAQPSTSAPDTVQAYFSPAFSVAIPLAGHAVAEHKDPLDLYRALYAQLAGELVVDGFLEHGVGVLASEREAHDAWVTLGFGRSFTLALRGVEPLATSTRTDLEIRTAAEPDLREVFALLAEQRAFHARAPMFLPDLRILRDAQEGQARWLQSQPRCPTFLACRDGRALGMQLFAPAGIYVSWPTRDESTAYLFQGVVRDTERGGGVGAALLQHALAWMRRENLRRCGLHYLSANPSGAVFWTRHGFRPVEHFLHRTVDARIAWSAR
ncbi:MAG: GNAT family N-acetyltransferase [Myxococcota bacterium]